MVDYEVALVRMVVQFGIIQLHDLLVPGTNILHCADAFSSRRGQLHLRSHLDLEENTYLLADCYRYTEWLSPSPFQRLLK